eukprot:TRINITY_DN9599_c0_g1_i5.p1 TRINITY_DN9599_c0_g1~~TRINITY_DN9599_c0_g1_i5.p1  ORF type:complete len:127 (-),score=15.59 TRINITY_DN9599_c0_g1_i5:72-452(-)
MISINKVFHFANALAGVAVVAIGIYGLVLSHSGMLSFIIALYLCMFGLILVGSKGLNSGTVNHYFAFLLDYRGVGLFLVFVGLMCMNFAKDFGFVTGIVIIVLGSFQILYRIFFTSAAPLQERLLG